MEVIAAYEVLTLLHVNHFQPFGASNKLNKYIASNFPSVSSSVFQLMAITVREIALYAMEILINFFSFRTHILQHILHSKHGVALIRALLSFLNGRIFQTVYLFPFFHKKLLFF